MDWADEAPTFELLKQMVTMEEIAELLGLDVDARGKITSPWNQDEKTPSCHLYEDHFWDYSAGKGGDAIDLVRAFVPGLSSAQALYRIWRRALKAGKEPGDVERVPVPNLTDFSDDWPNLKVWEPHGTWSRHLKMPLDFKYLTDQFKASEGVRLPSLLLIGHADETGRIYGVKTRGADGRKGSWPGSQFSHKLYHPFAWDLTGQRSDLCVIVEGESDCWSMSNAVGRHVPVFALPSGASCWKDKWLESLQPYDRVILCFDNDPPGNKARDKVTSKVGWLRAEQLFVPTLYDDVRAASAAGWRPVIKGV